MTSVLYMIFVLCGSAAWCLLAASLLFARTRHYLSTACFHGVHPECRRTCKFCAEPCRCTCHT